MTLIDAATLVTDRFYGPGPFEALLAELDSLMMAHVVYPAVDDRPAGYSPLWIRERLRAALGYRGVVFSDDLGMHAAAYAGNLADRMRLSLDAGCDAVLVCQPGDVASCWKSGAVSTARTASGPAQLAGATPLTAGRDWPRSASGGTGNNH